MSTTYSHINQMIDRVRAFADLESFNAKYNNTWILRNLIQPAYRDLFGRINNNGMQNRIIEEFDLDVVQGTDTYLLPPGIRHVLGFYYLGSNGEVEEDWHPSTHFDRGQSWRVEGINGRPFLRIDTNNTLINKTRTMRIYYVGTQNFEWSYGSVASYSGGTTFSLGSTTTIGVIERKLHGLVGGVLRVFNFPTEGAAINAVSENPISAYDANQATVTSRFPFTETTGGTPSIDVDITYEVMPIYSESLIDACVMGACLGAANLTKMSGTQKQDLRAQMLSHRKTALDDGASINLRLPERVRRDTVDRAYELQEQVRFT